MSQRTHNFSAGPGVLPLEVLMEVKEEIPVFSTSGATVFEISHRSKEYSAVADSARSLIRKLLGLSDDWHILFLQGGASLQFYQVPLNFLKPGGRAAYANTGSWSKKAIKEARTLGTVDVVASSEDSGFSYIPDSADWSLESGTNYVHFTSNNTIYGTEYAADPVSEVPLVCDASSDFMSRPMDLQSYGLIYAGAQKNVGPAGLTVVLVRDGFLSSRNDKVPTLLDYGTHAEKLYHTPPVFAVYVMEKVMRWLDRLGGLSAIQDLNKQKAAEIYNVIDGGDFYRGVARKDSRSLMNVTFRLSSEELEARFIAEAAGKGLMSLKGHRSAGGIRASIYNACPQESVDALASFMRDFERANG